MTDFLESIKRMARIFMSHGLYLGLGMPLTSVLNDGSCRSDICWYHTRLHQQILWSPHKVCQLWMVVNSECCQLPTLMRTTLVLMSASLVVHCSSWAWKPEATTLFPNIVSFLPYFWYPQRKFHTYFSIYMSISTHFFCFMKKIVSHPCVGLSVRCEIHHLVWFQ